MNAISKPDDAISIEAVLCNHSTSAFAELAIRSFYQTHPDDAAARFTVMDNASQDPTDSLEAYLAGRGIPFVQSGHDSATQQANSHGEVLQRFVQTHPDCDYYLLLDADICFVTPHTVYCMLEELQRDPDAWAVQARSCRTTRRIFEVEGRVRAQ